MPLLMSFSIAFIDNYTMASDTQQHSMKYIAVVEIHCLETWIHSLIVISAISTSRN